MHVHDLFLFPQETNKCFPFIIIYYFDVSRNILKGKRVSVGTADKTSTCSNLEFQELSFDTAKILRGKNTCSEDIITAVIKGAVSLLNLPAAIHQKATLGA